MLVTAIATVIVLSAAVAYVVFRKFSVTRQEIEFVLPQNGVAAIYLDIKEDTVRRVHIVYDDGTVSEVAKLQAA